MAQRTIIKIDEDKCDGCGACVISCAEGALQIIDGKAKLISDIYCDGLGACLGECPTGALELITREAEEFDEVAVEEFLSQGGPVPPEAPAGEATLACGCPGSLVQELKPMAAPTACATSTAHQAPGSALRNWPVQLHLLPVTAPFFQNADLLIAADCAGFSLTALHRDYLPGRSLVIACPKLDDTSGYQDKLAEIFAKNQIQSITVLYMTVPCCFGLVHLVKQSLAQSGKNIPLRLVQIEPDGSVAAETTEQAA